MHVPPTNMSTRSAIADQVIRRFVEMLTKYPLIAFELHMAAGLLDGSTQYRRSSKSIPGQQRKSNAESLQRRIESYDQALTVEELAKILNCSTGILYKQIKAGSLPVVRLGAIIRLCPAATIEWLNTCLTTA